ncbi:MAG: TetR/AcrR family transcriptional regulator [Acidimicrobiales bacterium]
MARRDPPVRRTKQDVSDAALKLFCERGYHAVTVEEIAAAAGVTKGAFYYYFADKEDLAQDLWHELWGRLVEAARDVYDQDKPVAANLKRCFRATLESISGLGEARFFLREAWVLPKVEVAGRADQQAAAALIGSIFDQAGDDVLGGLDVEAASAVLLGAYAEAMLHILTTGEAEPALAVLDRVIDALVPAASSASIWQARKVEAAGRPREKTISIMELRGPRVKR